MQYSSVCKSEQHRVKKFLIEQEHYPHTASKPLVTGFLLKVGSANAICSFVVGYWCQSANCQWSTVRKAQQLKEVFKTIV